MDELLALPPLPDDDGDDLTTAINSGVVHVGEAPSNFLSRWVLTTVCFHGFANLPLEEGSCVESSNFHCLGHEWFIYLYPGGDEAENEEEEDAAEEDVYLYLIVNGKGSVNIEYGVGVEGFMDCRVFQNIFAGDGSGFGYPFLKRETALTYLVKGTLVVQVWMRLYPTTFIPKNPSSNPKHPHSFLGSIFMDKKSADVCFEVVGRGGQADLEITNSSRKFYAHRLVLRKFAPQLADLCISPPDNSPTVVEVQHVSAQAFAALVRYIYGLNIFDVGNDIARIKDVLEVADKYGVVNLKLEMEELLVSSISVDVDNFIDHLTYAESKNCALLKETVMDFIIKSWKDIHASKQVANIPHDLKENLLNDVMMAVAIKIRSDDGDGKGLALDTMNIRELRQKAYGKHLDVDGSRETLISLLK